MKHVLIPSRAHLGATVAARLPLALLLAAACTSMPLLAQDASRGVNADFAKLDTNKDGFLSRTEAKPNQALYKIFAKADANKDGRLDEDEYLKGVNMYTAERTKAYADDSTITTKVKAALLGTSGVPSTLISVNTAQGKVTLSGELENKEQVALALKTVRGVGGVKSVINQLTVKK